MKLTTMADWSKFVTALTEYKKAVERRADIVAREGGHSRQAQGAGSVEGQHRTTLLGLAKAWHGKAMLAEATPSLEKSKENLKTEPKKRDPKKKIEEDTDAETGGADDSGVAAGVQEGSDSE